MNTKSFTCAALLWCFVIPAFAADIAPKPPPTPLLTQPADKLVAVLQSNASRKEKADACRELAVIGTRKSVSVLVELLADEQLSHMARYALETMPGSRVSQALRQQLNLLHGRPLVGVIGSLGVRQDTKAVKPLSHLLENADPDVAQAAARALGKIGNAEAAAAIQAALPGTPPANRLAFCEGWFRCAEALRDRGKAKEAVAICNQLRGIPGLPNQVRAGALRGAILYRGQQGLALLKESLCLEDPVLFNAAIRASMETPGPEVTRILEATLPQLRPTNQVVALQALGARGDTNSVTAIYALAKNGEPKVRKAAVNALAAINQPVTVPALAELTEDRNREISLTARKGLAGIPGSEADAAVLDMVKHGTDERRLAGIDLTEQRRMTAAVPVLLTAATDANANIRSAAIRKLGELGGPAELPALLKLLAQATEVRDLDATAEAIGSLAIQAGKPEAIIAQIISAIGGSQPAQRKALMSTLCALGGPRPLASARAALQDADSNVQDAAVRALADWPDVQAVPDLLKLARSDRELAQRVLALRGYIRLAREHPASAEEQLNMLREAAATATSAQDKKLVLSGLGDITSIEALRLAASHLSDPELADEAGTTVMKITAKLDATEKAAMQSVLSQVLQSCKSATVLDKARNRLKELGLEPTAPTAPSAPNDQETGFQSLFNGKDLSGWVGRTNHWSVEDGAITGVTTKENPAHGNNFLIAQDGDKDRVVGDFELRLSFRMAGDWGNSGIQYRSLNMGDCVARGYQADMETGPNYTGILYEEGGRGILARRGEKVRITDDPAKPGSPKLTVFGSLGDGKQLQEVIKSGGWNDYKVIARGNHLEQYINGKQMIEVVDEQAGKAASSGILALQLHAGPPMKVQFKDIRIKALP